MSAHEHEGEPVPGLPGELPAGERLLWQGSPSWRALALRALHVRKVGIYFLLLAAWHVIDVSRDGVALFAATTGALWLVVLGAAAIGVLAVLAAALARSTVYTVTTSRVVVRFGVALPMSVNLPLRLIESADIARHRDGTGDLRLTLVHGQRVGYLINWPHVAPWHYFRVRPMLRGVAAVEAAASALCGALAATQQVAAPASLQRPSREAPAVRPHTVTTAAA